MSKIAAYKISPPSVVRKLFPDVLWRINSEKPKLYLTFDDGPSEATIELLNCLNGYKVKATFFCSGSNVEKNPVIFKLLTDSGMSIGNHTYSHKKAFFTSKKSYFEDIDKCSHFVNSKLFRPPYGQLFPWWMPELKKRFEKIVMWDIMSYDFDRKLSKYDVKDVINNHIRPGSIIVFHDKTDCFERTKYALEKVIETAFEKGFEFDVL